jgi:hypothetical protein
LFYPIPSQITLAALHQGQLYAESPKAAKKEAATFVTQMCPGGDRLGKHGWGKNCVFDYWKKTYVFD